MRTESKESTRGGKDLQNKTGSRSKISQTYNRKLMKIKIKDFWVGGIEDGGIENELPTFEL